jgi:3'(2'), 5'-bisphosphate nucleotidase
VEVAALWDELVEALTPLLLGYRARLSDIHVTRKADDTLLSEADVAVQDHIVSRLRAYDPGARIVAEETAEQLGAEAGTSRVWVVDPIDGTAEFVRADRREYCSVICLLEGLRPVAALVVAPQIGTGRTPVVVRVDGEGLPIKVNGRVAPRIGDTPGLVSVTRSSGTLPRPWERSLTDAGFDLKTRTTSQTLDMVRTAVDLSVETGGELPPFALFYREAQKVWDGAAGMCLARAAELRVCDRYGTDRALVDADLNVREPTFPSTLVAAPVLIDQFLSWSRERP